MEDFCRKEPCGFRPGNVGGSWKNVGRFCQFREMLADFVRFSKNVLADCDPFGRILANFPTMFSKFEFRPAQCHLVVRSWCRYWSVCTRGGGRGNNSAKLRVMRGTGGGGGANLAAPYDGQRLM